MACKMEFGGRTRLNEVRIVKLDMGATADGKVAVTVPCVVFWKMVVFEW